MRSVSSVTGLLRSFAVLTLLALPIATEARGDSFVGTFTSDDQVQVLPFALAWPSTVTIRTFGYAGGTNGAGTPIAAGGFDPVLSLFQGSGANALLIGLSDDANCGPVLADVATGACWDSYLNLVTLPAGAYMLALTQADNTPNGTTLADGFGRAGQGDFTGPAFHGTAGGFWDANSAQRTANWAVDISLPEPRLQGPGLFLFLALSTVGFDRARRRSKEVRRG